MATVACFCGFTKQYPGFQELQKKFGDKFTVIAFPCNQFGGQEPGTPAQIKEFIKQFGIERLPDIIFLFVKLSVNQRRDGVVRSCDFFACLWLFFP